MIRDTVPRAADQHPRSPCYNDLRFISPDRELGAQATKICETCEFRACRPVLLQILSRPTDANALEGTWDGKHYRETRDPARVVA